MTPNNDSGDRTGETSDVFAPIRECETTVRKHVATRTDRLGRGTRALLAYAHEEPPDPNDLSALQSDMNENDDECDHERGWRP